MNIETLFQNKLVKFRLKKPERLYTHIYFWCSTCSKWVVFNLSSPPPSQALFPCFFDCIDERATRAKSFLERTKQFFLICFSYCRKSINRIIKNGLLFSRSNDHVQVFTNCWWTKLQEKLTYEIRCVNKVAPFLL